LAAALIVLWLMNMENPFTSLDILETETQSLLRQLSAKREEVQQGHQLQRLQQMQQSLQTAAHSIHGVLPDTDPLWNELRNKQQEIEQQLEEMAVSAPISALSFALESFPQMEDELASPYLLEQPDSSEWSDSPLTAAPVSSPTSGSSAVGLSKISKIPVQITLIILVTLFLTVVIGGLRLSQTQRLSPNRPFISNPVSQ